MLVVLYPGMLYWIDGLSQDALGAGREWRGHLILPMLMLAMNAADSTKRALFVLYEEMTNEQIAVWHSCLPPRHLLSHPKE